jgi:hypothetical protein
MFLLHFQAFMRAKPHADAALPAYDGRSILFGKMDRPYNAGFAAFSAFDAFFFIQDNAPAFPIEQRPGRARHDARPFVFAREAVQRDETAANPPKRSNFYRALGIGIAVAVHTGANALTSKTSDAFIHFHGLQDFHKHTSGALIAS